MNGGRLENKKDLKKNRTSKLWGLLPMFEDVEPIDALLVVGGILAIFVFLVPIVPQTNLHVTIDSQGISLPWIKDETVTPYSWYKTKPLSEQVGAVYKLNIIIANQSTLFGFEKKVIGEHVIRLPYEELPDSFSVKLVLLKGDEEIDEETFSYTKTEPSIWRTIREKLRPII